MSATTTFEEELARKGNIIYPNVGDSMMPLIRQGKDLLIIQRPAEWNGQDYGESAVKLKRLDVPLYKRDNGAYVLHRILKVRKKDYVICGDNRYCREYGITDKNIIGVLTGVIRDGREISVTDFKYRVYSHIWCDFFYIRALVLRTGAFVRKIKNRKRR